MTTPNQRLAELSHGCSDAEMMAFYDALAPVVADGMLGSWHGAEIPTGHPLGGLLDRYGWFGKRFDDAEHVHPLVMQDRFGRFAIDPTLLPVRRIRTLAHLARTTPVDLVAPRLLRAAATRRPQARLRMMEHRGSLTATMVYDRLPIHDHFRRVDDSTVVGAMDLRGVEELFFFALRREA